MNKIIVIDPCYDSSFGHHEALNSELLATFSSTHNIEVWASKVLQKNSAIKNVFDDLGYYNSLDFHCPKSNLKLIDKMLEQLNSYQDNYQSADLWIAHSFLPFHLAGFSRFLMTQNPTVIFISLMFDPADPIYDSNQSFSIQQRWLRGLIELSIACNKQKHKLIIGSASNSTNTRYLPLLDRAKVVRPVLHPAVVGGGCIVSNNNSNSEFTILLHWGDLKKDKGMEVVFVIIKALLSNYKINLSPCKFIFHSFSHLNLATYELTLLALFKKKFRGNFIWLEGQISNLEMHTILSRCDLALLAYNPISYSWRSSGIFWCYSSARYAVGRTAAYIGYDNNWLQKEASRYGMNWYSVAIQDANNLYMWPIFLHQCIASISKKTQAWSEYSGMILGTSFADWTLKNIVFNL
jgi:hypothetical protein